MMNCSDLQGPGYRTSIARGEGGVLMGVLIIGLNGVVIVLMSWALCRNTTVPKLLVLALAVTDFCFGVGDVLVQTIRYYRGFCRTGGQSLCTVQAFMSNFMSMSSMLLVVAMCSERFVALRFPFKYARLGTMRQTLQAIGLLLIYSALVAALPLTGVINSYTYSAFGCDFLWTAKDPTGSFYAIYRAIQGLVFAVLLIAMNAIVLRELLKMRSKVAHEVTGDDNGSSSSTAPAQHRRFVVLVVTVSITFILCNAPYMVRLLEFQSGVESPPFPAHVVKRMYISNSIVNPLLSIAFYLSGVALKHCACVKKHPASPPVADTATSNY